MMAACLLLYTALARRFMQLSACFGGAPGRAPGRTFRRLSLPLAALTALVALIGALAPTQALAAPPVIATSSLPDGRVADAYSTTITATGGTGVGYTYSLFVGQLPAGLSLSAGGAITGTPTAGGNFGVTVRVTDSGGESDLADLNVLIVAPTVNIGGSEFAPTVRTVPFDEFITASGGTAPYTFSIVSGTLPTGLTLSSDGHVTGTPSALGVFEVTIRALDSSTGTGPYERTRFSHIEVGEPPLAIGPLSVAAGAVGASYSQTFTGSGGTGTGYQFQVSGGALPAGLSLASNGALTGAPTAGGSFNVTVMVIDSSFVGETRDYTVVIAAPTITVTPTTLPDGVRDEDYLEALGGSGGTADYTFAVSSGALPTGLTLGTDGQLSGTPTATGTFNFTVTATDDSTGTGPYAGSRAYSIDITAPALAVTPTSLPAGAVSASYSETIGATGGTGTGYSFAVTSGALPAGLTLDSDGALTGTPTAGGSFPVTVTVTDSGAATASRAYTLVVGAPTVALAPATLPGGSVGASYSQTVTASGGTSGYSFAVTAGALPTGLSLAANGGLTGTASASGTFNFTITATDSSTGSGPYTGARAYSIVIAAAAPTLTPASLPAGLVGAVYEETFGATGGSGLGYSLVVTEGSLPPGLSLDGDSGMLTGTPTAGDSFDFAVTVTDSNGGTATRAYTLVINAPTILLDPTSLPDGTEGDAYNEGVTASGGTADYTFAVTAGSLPNGLALDAEGEISGTPSAPGTFNFTITATDSSTWTGPYNGSRAYSIVIAPPALALSPASLPPATVAAAYSETFTGNGGTGTGYSFAVTSGALPDGLSLASNGDLVGTPTEGGSFPVTVTVTDSGAATASQAYTLVVDAPTVVIDPATLPGATVDAAYIQSLSASGGTAGYGLAVTAGSLPGGLSLASGGLLSGTPTTAGSFSFTVTATDSSTGSGPYTGAQSYTLVVAGPTALPATAGPVAAEIAFNSPGQGVTLAPGGGYDRVELATSPAHGSVTISGIIATYVPEVGYSGADSFTYRAIGMGGNSSPATVSITVRAAPPPVTPAPTAGPLTAEVTFNSSGQAITLAPGGAYEGVELASDPEHGSVTISGIVATYIPAADYSGADSFSYRAIGTVGNSAPATVGITVRAAPPPVTPAPTAGPITAEVTFNSAGQAITLAPGGAYDSVVVATSPAHGSVTISGIVATYVPQAGYSGADSFTYRADGPGGSSPPATVGVTVAVQPPPPAATPTSVTIEASEVLSTDRLNINLSALVSGEFTSLVIITPPQHGTLVLERQAAPQLLRDSGRGPRRANAVYIAVYTPEPGYRGIDTFAYAAVGPGGMSPPAMVNITVLGDPPVLTPLAIRTAAGRAVSIDLTTPAEGGPFTAAAIASLSPSGSGTVALREAGAPGARTYRLEFTPNGTFTGTATVTYSLSNVAGTTSSTVTVTVEPRPDPSLDPAVRGLNDAQSRAALHFASAQIGNFNHRLERLHTRSDGGHLSLTLAPGAIDAVLPNLRGREPGASSFIGQWPESGRDAATRQALAEGLDEDGRLSAGRSGPRAIGSIEGWAGGEITIGRRDSSVSQAKLDLTSSGVSAGADLKLTEGLTLGFGGGVGRDLVKVGSDGSKLNAKDWVSAVYGSFSPEAGLFLDGVAGIGRLDYDLRRYSLTSGTFAAGERSGELGFASATGGWDHVADGYRWSAYGRLEYAKAELEAYAETGAGADNLTYAERRLDSLVGVLGGKWSLDRSIGDNVFAPRLRVEFRHEFRDAGAQTIRYSDWLTGLAYAAPDTGWAQDRVSVGLGLAISNVRTWRLDLDLGGEFGRDEMFGILRIEGAMKF